MSQMSPSAAARKAPQVRQRLMSRLAGEDELPALRGAVSQVVKLASSGDEAVGDLARFILSDVALTQKILRLANTVAYRTVSGTPVTTVSRAIFLLGFDTIITSAMAILLVDAFGDSRHADAVRTELYRSLCASAIARELSRRSAFRDAEEVAIAALFRNLGRILVAAREHDAYAEILRRAEGCAGTREAEIDVIGCTFDTLGVLMLREWRMPETTIAAMTPPSSGRLKPARSRQEWLQQTVEFSTDAAVTAMQPSPAACAGLLARYGDALDFDEEQLAALLAKAAGEARTLADNMALILP
ncbi:MAG: HDOD domain-containing protein, partial [Burkholderiaceae bacterium]